MRKNEQEKTKDKEKIRDNQREQTIEEQRAKENKTGGTSKVEIEISQKKNQRQNQ